MPKNPPRLRRFSTSTALAMVLVLSGCAQHFEDPWVTTGLEGGSLYRGSLYRGSLHRGSLAPERRGPACPAYASAPLFEFSADAETAYADDDPVPTMTDTGGSNSVDLTQATGTAQPTYQLPCGGLTSSACYSFDGGDGVKATAAAFGTHTQPNTICAVFLIDAHTTVPRIFTGDTGRNELRSSGVVFQLFAGSQAATTAAPTEDVWMVGCATFNGASSASLIDGTSNTGLNTGVADLAGFVVGANNSVDNNFLNGEVAHVVGWGASVDMAEATARLECLYPDAAAAGAARRTESRSAPLALSPEVKTRVLRYALAAYRRGVPLSSIVSRIASRTGHTEPEVREAAKRVFGRRDREPSTRTAEQIGILVRTADVATVAEAYAQAACAPLVEEEDPDADACLEDERHALDQERYCLAGTSTEVGRGARWVVTSGQRDDFVAAWQALPSGVRTRSRLVREADDAAYLAAQAAGGVERCPEAT